MNSGVSSHSKELQGRILREHLETLARQHPSLEPRIRNGLTYGSTLASLEQGNIVGLPAGLSEDDLKRFAQTEFQLDSKSHQYLLSALRQTLQSISDIWDPTGSEEHEDGRERRLQDEIQNRKALLSDLDGDIQSKRENIVQLVSETNEVHEQLQTELIEAIEKLPPILTAERSAQYDILALTIETCLLKLSLLRTKTHNAIYNPHPSTNTKANMLHALHTYHQRLQSKAKAQETEEAALDAQLQEYEQLMDMVGGKGPGGFSQIVDDMARVKKETEECKRDLRRLGWTGD